MFHGKEIREINAKIDHLLCHVHELRHRVDIVINLLSDANSDTIEQLAQKLKGVRYSLKNAINNTEEKK